MKRTAASLALVLAACQPAAEASKGAIASEDCGPEAIVTEFYRQALVERDVRGGFAEFASPDFVEHKPDVAGGDREGAIRMLEGLIGDLPEARWEVLRVVADGDLAAVHARFTPAPGAEPYAIADFFKVADCRIVEHWDVVAGPVEGAANPNPRF